MICLGVNLFFEARNQPEKGKVWVMDVVTNRVDHKAFPDTVCDVVTQPKAFSWYFFMKEDVPEDALDWPAYVRMEYKNNPTELAALEECLFLAKQHLLNGSPDRTGGSLYYMTPSGLGSQLAKIDSYSVVKTIQDHMFLDQINWR